MILADMILREVERMRTRDEKINYLFYSFLGGLLDKDGETDEEGDRIVSLTCLDKMEQAFKSGFEWGEHFNEPDY